MNEKQLDALITGLGGKLYLVGGAVRDSLMGKESLDRDYLVTGVRSLPFTKIAGKDFPVYLVALDGERFGSLMAQLALARVERKNGTGYHGFEIQTDPSITVEDDLRRRDLTINSIAIEVSSGKIIDPFGGFLDIEAGILRHTSEAFAEDPLRVYRTARFAAQFRFVVHPDTKALMLRLKPELKTLTPERVYMELVKALTTPYPDRFFKELDGLLDVHFPEIEALKVTDKHDGTAFEHTMQVLAHGVGLEERFALLCHDLGKGLSKNPPRHPEHHKQLQLIDSLCERIKTPKSLQGFAKRFMLTHMKVKHLDEIRTGKLIKFVEKDIFKLLRLSYLESSGRYDKATYIDHVKLAKKILKLKKQVTGDVLIKQGVTPDKTFGEKLLQLRVRRLREGFE
jgi:tRNA nucleotidyltransferase (CCA-adding enzyme)